MADTITPSDKLEDASLALQKLQALAALLENYPRSCALNGGALRYVGAIFSDYASFAREAVDAANSLEVARG